MKLTNMIYISLISVILTGCGISGVHAETLSSVSQPAVTEETLVEGGIRVNPPPAEDDISEEIAEKDDIPEDLNYESASRHRNFERLIYQIGHDLAEDE